MYSISLFLRFVYLITQNLFRFQYVGETCQKLNERFIWQNFCLGNPTKLYFCEILSNHFNLSLCKGSTYVAYITEKIQGADRNVMDASSTSVRKAREVYWMKEHKTVFPCELNVRIVDEQLNHMLMLVLNLG